MNIQNDKKKPFIIRRVVTIVCCLSVMLMLALPSLAVGGYDTYPAEYPAPPEGVTEFAILQFATSSSYATWIPVLVDFASNPSVTFVTVIKPSNIMVFCGASASDHRYMDYYLLEDNTWVKYRDYGVTQYTSKSGTTVAPVYSTVWLGHGENETDRDCYYLMGSDDYPSSNIFFAGTESWFMQKDNDYYYQYRFSDPDSVVITITDDQKVLSFEGTCSYALVYPTVSAWTTVANSFNISSYNIVNSNFILKTSTGEQYFPPVPPPPDPLEPVTAGLGYVLNWVGQTVSQLFDGTLSGLLPLVAVPVAVTLLIVAIFFIKRIIWGG